MTEAEEILQGTRAGRVISRREALDLFGMSEVSVWRCVKQGDIPPPIKFGPDQRRVGWLEADILNWQHRKRKEAEARRLQEAKVAAE